MAAKSRQERQEEQQRQREAAQGARDEQQDLRRREGAAQEQTAHFSMRFAESMADVAAPARAERAREQDASRPPLHLMFGTERGLRLVVSAIPGFAKLWSARVPDDRLLHVKGRDDERYIIVLCKCGAETVLTPTSLEDCAGADETPDACRRWFLATRSDVRWHEFPAELAAA